MSIQPIKEVQTKILDVMKYIDEVCRTNDIEYFIMGGTALGAIRHGGFIPWDDDLDIFITPSNYNKFKIVFEQKASKQFVLQEWKIVDGFLEYAKVRMNGTTFIENSFKNNKDMHHGIYVDIMILHKCPTNLISQKLMYYTSKYVTLVGLSQRNWVPKNNLQKLSLLLLKSLPQKILSTNCYKYIYKFDDFDDNYSYCYFITKANFKQGVFAKEMFSEAENIKFEDTVLLGPKNIKKYLEYRYGDYLQLPSIEEQKAAIHAEVYDTESGFENYFANKND
jgi:lipopolysaccharide cholinephosphotransferase